MKKNDISPAFSLFFIINFAQSQTIDVIVTAAMSGAIASFSETSPILWEYKNKIGNAAISKGCNNGLFFIIYFKALFFIKYKILSDSSTGTADSIEKYFLN